VTRILDSHPAATYAALVVLFAVCMCAAEVCR
jgi:hypothetical protein